MNLKFKLLLALVLISMGSFAQTMPSTASAYNAPYDTLIAMGNKGISSGLILGVQSPNMGMMFYNRAIEIAPENPIAYQMKGKAYLDYNMLSESVESYTQCLDIDPNNVGCIQGMFNVSAKGTTNYQLDQVPLPMMKQTYQSAMAFIKVATPDLAGDVAYAELLGYAFKLGIDNNDLYKKYIPIVLKNQVDESMALSAQEILPAVQATGNNQVVATLCDKIANYYFKNDNVAKTKEFGQKGLASGFALTTTYYFLGYTYYYDDKNPTEAIKVLEEGLKKKGEYAQSSALLSKIQYLEGQKAYDAKNYPLAITYLSSLIQNNPNHERGNAYLGFAYFNNKKYPEAAKALKSVKKLANVGNVNIYYPNLSVLIAFAEKPTATPPSVQTILADIEKNEAIYKNGESLYDNQDYPGAMAKFKEALTYFTGINDQPSMEVCYNLMGLCSQDSKDYESAKNYYIKSIEMGASNSSSYENYGLLLYALDKDYLKSEAILNSGLEKFPDNNYLIKMKAKMYISHAYDFYNVENYSESVPFFNQGLALIDDAEAYIYLGYAYNSLKDMDKAYEAWDTAFYLDSDLASDHEGAYNYVQSRK